MTRIMTNVAAINAQRNLEQTSIKMGKVLEQLSSGYRINRAADDAAGLGISEKMRAQIRGNQQALKNVQDGISMLQTGEGAMDEVHSMLQRIRELAVQAANGTYTDNGPERTSIGQEIVQLASEIDRIANSTEFNGQKLLTGNLSVALGPTGLQNGTLFNGAASGAFTTMVPTGGGTTAVPTFGAAAPGNYTVFVNGSNLELRSASTGTVVATAPTTSQLPALAGANPTFTFTNGLQLKINNTAAYTITNLTGDIGAAGKALTIGGTQATAVDVAGAKPQAYALSVGAPNTLTLTGADGSTQTIAVPAMTANEVRTLQFSNLGINVTLTNGGAAVANPETVLSGQTINATGSGSSSTLQVGANVPDTLSMNFTNMQTSGLGGGGFLLGGPTGLVTTLGASGIVGTIQASHDLMTAVDGAIQQLSTQRGTLGAAQNRLEHTMNSLGVSVENLSASESRIRDADIAELSSEMVSNQILQQAGVSVLSQANQAPQAVLKLLQS
jgi:flagellin